MIARPVIAAFAIAIIGLGACEKHTAPSVRGAPEYLHEALSGDLAAEQNLARCYDKGAECGLPADPALACAWRGVRLASRSPQLTLADNTDFVGACALSDPTMRQRAAILLGDLAWRVRSRDLPDLPELTEAVAKAPLLYPAAEAVRANVNRELGLVGRSEQLPALTRPPAAKEGQPIAWTSCGGPVCFEATTPPFGGGVVDFRVTVAASAGAAQSLAARLAAAGLDDPSAFEVLAGAGPRGVVKGPVCWMAGRAADNPAYAAASLSPCGATSAVGR